jgi:CubicO group peptidase (beta-lactamase class C family)
VGVLAELTEKLAEVATALGVPGAVAGVVSGGRSYVACHGVDNVEFPSPITAATRFQVGSVTKTFASAVVMMLAQEGRLALDDPVGKHLPRLGSATGLDTDAITLEIALSHRAGFDGDHLFVTAGSPDLSALRTARRLFDPGDGFSYNNAGFSIVGAVVESVTGEPFADVVRDRLLKPLGMTGAGFRADDLITYPVAAPHWVADGDAYVIRGAGWQPGWQLEPVDHAAGGLVASVDHLTTWARFQATGAAADGTSLLAPASLERLHTPVVQADMTESVALDWFVRDIDGARSIGHGGTTAGYQTELVIVSECDTAFIGLTNSTNGSWVNDEMRRWCLARFAGLRDQPLEPARSLVVDTARCHGRFVHAFGILTVDTDVEDANRVRITSSARDDVDGWQPPLSPPLSFAFVNDDHAVAVAPGPQKLVRFGFDSKGDATWILWDSRRAVRDSA